MKKRVMICVCMILMGLCFEHEPLLAMTNETVEERDTDETFEESETDETDETFEESETDETGETFEESETDETGETFEESETDETGETFEESKTDETKPDLKESRDVEKEIKTKDMYRLYNPNSGEHFYTSTLNEREHLKNAGWKYEGISWKSPEKGNPVYRLYNPNAGDHHYTCTLSEKEYLESVGWKYEGIGWYSDVNKTVPVFRLYNPNAVTGTHHYTANYNEVQSLIKAGWKYEGIGWYSSDIEWLNSGYIEGTDETIAEHIEIGNLQEDSGMFDVIVYVQRANNQIYKIYVPVWTKSNQSDIYWYVADKQSDGTYKVTVDALNHQWNSGQYRVDCYIQTPKGDMKYVDGTSVHMQPKIRYAVSTIDQYSARITAAGLGSDVSKVRFPTWTVENGQDDIVWHQGQKNKNGTWTVDIHSNQHKKAGAYITDIYTTVNGSETCVQRVEYSIADRLVNTWTWINGYKRYINANGEIDTDVSRLVKGPYFIKVYKWSNYLIIYAKDEYGNYTVPVKAMIASCGNNTPTGTYYTPYRWRWLTMVGGSKAQWCTQIIGDYLFHSVPYRIADPTTLYVDSMFNYLGTTQSLGCIRLQAGDAKWIYDNCELGTQVLITPNESSGPIDKPSFTPVPSWHTWDPTDPTVKYLCQKHGCH